MAYLLDGYTLMHEHITIDLSKVKGDMDCRLDCFEETVKELKELYGLGVRNIVDVTNMGMGRNPEYVSRVEALTGIHILQSTGFYKEPFLPQFVFEDSVEQLAKLMTKEITEGFQDTGIRADLIGEIGTSKGKMEPMEKKVFDAAILSAKQTGKPIYTHTTLGTYALEQVDYFLDRGLSPRQIVIGHIDLSKDLSYIMKVLEKGVYVGFDTVGKDNYFPDGKRVEFLLELEHRKLQKQVVLSMDLTRKTHLKYKGGIGYAHLFDKFLPMLRSAGMSETSLQQMLVENPKEIFR